MICELCGLNYPGLYNVEIEGATMALCKQCSKSGNIISEIKQEETESKTQNTSVEEQSLRLDYGKVLSEAAKEAGLNLDAIADTLKESETTLCKIFEGKIIPEERISKKLEKLLKVSLTEVSLSAPQKPEKNENLTIGDVVKIKQR